MTFDRRVVDAENLTIRIGSRRRSDQLNAIAVRIVKIKIVTLFARPVFLIVVHGDVVIRQLLSDGVAVRWADPIGLMHAGFGKRTRLRSFREENDLTRSGSERCVATALRHAIVAGEFEAEQAIKILGSLEIGDFDDNVIDAVHEHA